MKIVQTGNCETTVSYVLNFLVSWKGMGEREDLHKPILKNLWPWTFRVVDGSSEVTVRVI